MELHIVLANCLFFFSLGLILAFAIRQDEIKILNKEIRRSYEEAEELREQVYLLTHNSPIRRK